MNSDQVKLLRSLAKEMKSIKKDKAKAVATLRSANILTKNGNFTSKYKNLNHLITAVASK